ncbi:DUF6809 family protein [Allofournierella sp.]|uniref:DUF6809 family protein n=1 Tax=Allofournierella sp. TaxID=1940256 RepID=UPI003AB490F7
MSVSISDLFSSAWDSRTIRKDGPCEQALAQLIAVERRLHDTLEGETLEQFKSFSNLSGTLGGISDTENFELGFRLCFALIVKTLFGRSENFSDGGFL